MACMAEPGQLNNPRQGVRYAGSRPARVDLDPLPVGPADVQAAAHRAGAGQLPDQVQLQRGRHLWYVATAPVCTMDFEAGWTLSCQFCSSLNHLNYDGMLAFTKIKMKLSFSSTWHFPST